MFMHGRRTIMGRVLQWMEEWGCEGGETERRGPGKKAGWREAGESEVEMERRDEAEGDGREWERS